jgi:hypothetical protein
MKTVLSSAYGDVLWTKSFASAEEAEQFGRDMVRRKYECAWLRSEYPRRQERTVDSYEVVA